MTGAGDGLAIASPDELVYGECPQPVSFANGMTIGDGTVYPEINFTLPDVDTTDENSAAVVDEYRAMTEGVCERARRLEVPGLVVEVELLPSLTTPEWARRIVGAVADVIDGFETAGLDALLRVTPTDTRAVDPEALTGPDVDLDRAVARYRDDPEVDAILETFEVAARAGADILSIESAGGSAICGDAIAAGDLATVAVALGVLGTRDVAFLWEEITAIAASHGVVAGGDTACAFANTAMAMTAEGHLPESFAAAVRVASVERTLTAHRVGATGPTKDCALEGPYLKAIAGVPISMEGKTAAVAHHTPVGNAAAAACDLWSNESVQNVRLLGGPAPTVSMEQLAYDCRLLNRAGEDGAAGKRRLRDWLAGADAGRTPQAYVIDPTVAVALARRCTEPATPWERTRRFALEGIAAIESAVAAGRLRISDRERPWLDRMAADIRELPPDPAAAWEAIRSRL